SQRVERSAEGNPRPSARQPLTKRLHFQSGFQHSCPANTTRKMSAPAGAPGADGANQPPNLTSNRRLQQTQAQVDEVVDIMRVNVDKVLERDQKLSELDDRADALQAGASQFETSAAKLKNKYWWKNAKCTSAPKKNRSYPSLIFPCNRKETLKLITKLTIIYYIYLPNSLDITPLNLQGPMVPPLPQPRLWTLVNIC
ncbi:hypothetical protein F7725_007202, partial [Dissostichus mawsoni]